MPFLHPYDRSAALSIKNGAYQRVMQRLILDQIKEDLGAYDRTTALLAPQTVHAVIIAKKNGIIAGIEECQWCVQKIGLKMIAYKKNGEKIQKGERIIKFFGTAEKILSAERTILNMMQRMSGIATTTKKIVEKIKPRKIQIAATRKTPCSLLDKKAVAVGGGLTHRLTLADGILIKNTHWELQGEKRWPVVKTRFYGVEVRNDMQLKKALLLFSTLKDKTACAILFDNQTPERIKKLLKKIPPEMRQKIICEASGGITEKNAIAYAKTGVDIISIGALTHSVKALDLSLKIVQIRPPLNRGINILHNIS